MKKIFTLALACASLFLFTESLHADCGCSKKKKKNTTSSLVLPKPIETGCSGGKCKGRTISFALSQDGSSTCGIKRDKHVSPKEENEMAEEPTLEDSESFASAEDVYCFDLSTLLSKQGERIVETEEWISYELAIDELIFTTKLPDSPKVIFEYCDNKVIAASDGQAIYMISVQPNNASSLEEAVQEILNTNETCFNTLDEKQVVVSDENMVVIHCTGKAGLTEAMSPAFESQIYVTKSYTMSIGALQLNEEGENAFAFMQENTRCVQ